MDLFDTELFEEIEDEDVEEQGELTDVMYELIDEVSLGLCFEVHRSAKIGLLFLDDTDPDSQKDYQIIDEQGVDVFGQVPLRKQYECICPNCQRNLAAARFAPHLEKCMGMGRNSSRIASRRIQANHGRKESDNESEEDNDNEWSYLGDRKAKRLKREKAAVTNSPRRAKSQKHKNNGDAQSVSSAQSDSAVPVYDVMSMEERKSLLLQTCGVISEHTKKMCTRSIRCPQHSDDQRKAVRAFLLTTNSGGEPSDEVHVDIDSFEDQAESNSSQALREALLFQEETTNSSPADSNSTTNSSGSKKRKHSKKNNKRKRDRSVTPNVMR